MIKHTHVFRWLLTLLVMLATIVSAHGKEQQKVPGQVYTALEYVLALSHSDADLEPEKLTALIDFVRSIPAESSLLLRERRRAVGAFHAFLVKGSLANVLELAYNPDIPSYVTMPSSVQEQEWLTPEVNDELRKLPRKVESVSDIRFLRGRDREVITPDTNTGGYYSYTQDRIVALLPGSTGPVLISVSSQTEPSGVGKKGCVAGNDKNWNYLYSDETGLSKTGLGWVDSYMYHADSVVVYVADAEADVLHVGSFKWLNGGWAKINMVQEHHILKGIKRFASDFKAVLESPGVADPQTVAGKYHELQQLSDEELRQMVSPYLEALADSGVLDTCPDPLESMVSSDKYLNQMTHDEMVRVLLLEYVKELIGKEPSVEVAAQPEEADVSSGKPWRNFDK
ncbi:MAG: hypothetical protein ACWGOX_15960 [Desulforhopalus sp.]